MSDFQPVRKLEVVRRLQQGGECRVGVLAQSTRGVFFQYDDAYVDAYHSLSPFLLPFDTQLHTAPASPHHGIHGLFADSLPDGWGLMLMDRVFRQHGIAPRQVTAMDRLAYVGDRGMGALRFRPLSPYVHQPSDHWIDIGRLGEEARQLFEGQTETVLEALAEAGSSGGARPKAQLYFSSASSQHASTHPQEGLSPWLVKFTSSSLSLGHEEGLCEAAYLSMAASAGIDVPEWRLLPPPNGAPAVAWLATKRFDCATQNGQGRYHLHSACGLLDADFRLPSLDYEDLIKAGQILCGAPRVGQALFRRAIFNLLAVNQDDHSKNWAFLMDDAGQWSLAPFYDVTFSPSPFGEHATAYCGHGKTPPRNTLQRLADQAGFTRWSQAREVIEEVADGVQQWARVSDELGVSRGTRQLIQKALDDTHEYAKTLLAG
ncbi:type II toxin-antitoxin system HipA family toxin [Chromohalobacter nigrandesensis]|uniref:type II toxin-antitoxin system HipA family toxin n=1 Tax=Chromohalobacter nigrandesensis TaxID=119863 RepID=UPI001FF274CA|nr:type II toxin-antitoxin system HipA family toxin [Chromohalobacter nigrandesensis]MCK0744899.1 type II toxin-antitoxin system HipA family toxin [Chromohalobacter nigrandesensis]